MPHPTIRVRVASGHVPLVDEHDRPVPGRYAARDHLNGHAPIEAGADVPATPYYARAIRDGSLALIEEAAS